MVQSVEALQLEILNFNTQELDILMQRSKI